MKKLVLIDGHSILNRAFYGVPPLTNSAGLHTNAVYGFMNIMFKILDEEEADYLAVAFDLPLPTFRHKLYEEYKATRKEMPGELIEQVGLMKRVLGAMQIPVLSCEGYEADDVIGTIAKRYAGENLHVSVVSGDRDLLQLADTQIKIRIPKTSKGRTEVRDYYPEDVKQEYQVSPKEFIDVKALMGDPSDNIPGVKSIGEKTATAIIKEYRSIENAYRHVEEIKPPRAAKALAEHYESAEFSKLLATIKLDAPIETSLEEMEIKSLYNAESLKLVQELEFKSMLRRFDTGLIADTNRAEVEYELFKERRAAQAALKSLAQEKELALDLLYEEGASLAAAALSFSEEKVFLLLKGEFLSGEEIEELLCELIRSEKTLYIRELKPLVKALSLEERKNLLDISLAAYLNNPLKDSYETVDIARDFLRINLSSAADLFGKGSLLSKLLEGEEEAKRFFAAQAQTIFLAAPKVLKKLEELGMKELYEDIELPLVYALARMEEAGIGIDREALAQYAQELEGYILQTEKEIYEKTGEEFNINSPKQLGEILFGKLGMPGGKKTKTGYSTAVDVLDKLAPDYPVVKSILKYRQLSKLHSTYALGLSSYIAEDGRIHGSFNQTITATGRISSTEPNLQNIPIRTEMGSRIRDIFVPKEGYLFVDADYSQIELRVLASLSEDENLIESYQQSLDIHAATASQVFHVPIEEVTPLQRRNAKAVNFGVVYGISAFSLSEDLSISRKEALEYINNYFRTYPKVKRFLDMQVKKAKEEGFVSTLYGRIRPIPEIKSSNFNQRAFGDRVAMNSPIQGSAADIMKKAMLDVDRELRRINADAKIVLQVHDELLIEVKKEEAEKIRLLVEEKMKNAAKLKVALEVEAKIGETWLKAK
ncbi:MAG: DNA polymerase I [Johnsonella sp.]|nr:DNA polymerase I [Johnsonella sp.]